MVNTLLIGRLLQDQTPVALIHLWCLKKVNFHIVEYYTVLKIILYNNYIQYIYDMNNMTAKIIIKENQLYNTLIFKFLVNEIIVICSCTSIYFLNKNEIFL